MTAQAQVAAKACEGCGEQFERRHFPNGRLEDVARFVKRRFCSRDCYRTAAADGTVVRLPAVWIHGPHQPVSPPLASNGTDPRQATGSGYPWDRQRAAQGGPIPGPFSAERQTDVLKADSIKKTGDRS